MPSGMNRLAFVSLDPPCCRMVPSDVLQAAKGFKQTRKLRIIVLSSLNLLVFHGD